MPLDSRTPYPAERRQPIFNAPPGTSVLCLTLILFHAVVAVMPLAWSDWIVARLAFVPALFLAQLDGYPVPLWNWIRLLSYAVPHGDLLHLAVNTGMLLAFGSLVERQIGTVRFILLFAATAALAAVVQAFAAGPQAILVIGASGAGYGLLGAGVIYLYSGRVDRTRRDALVFVAVVMGLNLIFGLTGLGSLLTGAEIAWEAHIGGFIAGLLLILPLSRRRAQPHTYE